MSKQPSSLHTRIKSAFIFAPIVAAIVYLGEWLFVFMMAAAAAVAVDEWGRMVMSREEPPPFLLRATSVLAGISALAMGMVDNPVIALWFVLALCFLLFAYNLSQKGPSLKLLLFGFVYITFSIGIMSWLRTWDSLHGLYLLTTFILIVWGSDVFAYFAGRSIGGKKLSPKISPKKTWAGLFGGMAGAALIAAALAHPVVTNWLDADTIFGMSSVGYAIMGAVMGAAGQMGDLFISMFKRHFDIKDTGTLIPGHGGLLDRIDALLLVAYIFGSLAVIGA